MTIYIVKFKAFFAPLPCSVPLVRIVAGGASAADMQGAFY